MQLTKTEYSLALLLGFGLLIINGYLVLKVLKNEVEFDKSCPLPKEEVNACDCYYGALGDKSLRYCVCYPGNKFNVSELLTKDFLDSKLFTTNKTEIIIEDGTS